MFSQLLQYFPVLFNLDAPSVQLVDVVFQPQQEVAFEFSQHRIYFLHLL